MGCKKDRRLSRCVGGRVYRSALEQINFKLKCELSLCMFLKRIRGDVGTCQVILQFMIPGVFWYSDRVIQGEEHPAAAWLGARAERAGPRAVFTSPGPHGGWLRKGPELRSRVSVSLIAAYSKVHILPTSPSPPASLPLRNTAQIVDEIVPICDRGIFTQQSDNYSDARVAAINVCKRTHNQKSCATEFRNSQLGPVEF